MKLHSSELPLGKPQTRRKTSKLAPLVALIVLLTIPLYYPSIKESSKRLYETSHAYESLEDSIRPTSHLDSPPGENSNIPCSDGSPPCNEGDKVVHHHESVATGTKHEKGPTSHLDSPFGENSSTPCSGDSAQCDEHKGGGDTASHLHDRVDAEEKHKNEARLDSPSMENNNKPCSGDSPQCNEGRGSGDTLVDARKKHENRPHLDSPSREETNKPCSGNSPPCNESGDGGDMAMHHHEAAATGKNPVKGRRKRPRRPGTPDPSKALKDSPKQENKKEPTRIISNDLGMIRSKLLDDEQCDLFSGEWVPNPGGPYYTNDTCNAIQEHQNCIKFGRPDRGFLKWRWKPDDCELPVFDPNQFLELVRGKSLAFVGDSVARNHMQSLICLLSRVAQPEDLSDPLDQNKRYQYREHDFNISIFWSPYLVKTEKTDPNDEKRPFKLYLDEFDEHWTSNVTPFDYVIISAGHWFFRPTYFYLNHRLIGCLYCSESNVSHLTSYFSYRRAFRTAFRAINAAANFNGVVFLRTFAPSHFEGAAWDRGGDCARTGPYKRNETVLEDYSREMYMIQLEELRIAQRAGRTSGGKFRLFDATKAMLLRPDGHPSKYGHWPGANRSFPNDCVHWCLPGPIDSWNDFLQELLKREVGDNR
ncbi:hypothetical protein BUALT_Bualt16G0027600 [Buddleja alternifolia]|uniref:Trichome birefringence-like N-terminal domain-containing protein n=1 Tax=Buddleja alternifolia TaxID=168488 RepID=A0AAV6WHW4_9LAMI|nr:hypothetical protein BUALT_Bualt16G0027600 [Buddleja alternifolia]